MAEKETLQREIDEKHVMLDGVNEDVESRTKLLEMKIETRRYGIGPDVSLASNFCFGFKRNKFVVLDVGLYGKPRTPRHMITCINNTCMIVA